ncbi:hypothetical protein FRC11_004554, partial [Ceratobasidium sp. 423]
MSTHTPLLNPTTMIGTVITIETVIIIPTAICTCILPAMTDMTTINPKTETKVKHHIISNDEDEDEDEGLGSKLTQVKCKTHNESKPVDDLKVKQCQSGQTHNLSTHVVATAPWSESKLEELPKGKGNKNHINNQDKTEDELPKKKVNPLPPHKSQSKSELESSPMEVQALVKLNKKKTPPPPKHKAKNTEPEDKDKGETDELEDELLAKNKTNLAKKVNKPLPSTSKVGDKPNGSALSVKEHARKKM